MGACCSKDITERLDTKEHQLNYPELSKDPTIDEHALKKPNDERVEDMDDEQTFTLNASKIVSHIDKINVQS